MALGFSLAFGAMFSKTWRVHKIFTKKKIQKIVIKDYQLMAIVLVLVLVDVVVLTVWMLEDPLYLETKQNPLERYKDPYNDNQIIVKQSQYCWSQHLWYYAGILWAIKGLLLMFGAFLAYETRKVTVPALNDSKFIGISVYNVLVLCLIGVPTAMMIREQVDAVYLLTSLFTFFATTLTICLVFIPKTLKKNRKPQTRQMWLKAKEAAKATIVNSVASETNQNESTQIINDKSNNCLNLQKHTCATKKLLQTHSLDVEINQGDKNTTEKLIIVDNKKDYYQEIEELKEENRKLKKALKMCKRLLNNDEDDTLAFGVPHLDGSDQLTVPSYIISNSMPLLKKKHSSV